MGPTWSSSPQRFFPLPLSPTAATSMAIHAMSQLDGSADDPSPSPTPGARMSPSRIFAGLPTARGVANGSSTTARGARRAGWPLSPSPARFSPPLSLLSSAAAESSPSWIFAGPPTVRGVADGSSTTARGAWGGRRRGARRVASLSLSRSLLSLPPSLSRRRRPQGRRRRGSSRSRRWRAGWTTARGARGGLSLPLPLASLSPSLSLSHHQRPQGCRRRGSSSYFASAPMTTTPTTRSTSRRRMRRRRSGPPASVTTRPLAPSWRLKGKRKGGEKRERREREGGERMTSGPHMSVGPTMYFFLNDIWVSQIFF